jgi:hypothetical protein
MKSLASRLMKTSTSSLMAGLFLLTTSGAVFAQMPMKDVLKETAKEGAMEALGVKKPVQGQVEMMDGAKMMMNGKKTLKSDLVKNANVKEGAPLEGEMMMSEGYEMMVDGDKLLQAQKTPDGKKKMLDGAKMMGDAKKKMLDDLTKKGMIKADKVSEGETTMKDGEKMMKDGEMMMLK